MEKVLIVGQNLDLGTTEEVYGRQFSVIGSQVQYFTWTETLPKLTSVSLINKLVNRFAWKSLAKKANSKLVNIAQKFKPTLTFVVSPLLLHPDSILALQEYGPVFVFYTDNPLDSHHTHTNSWEKGRLCLWDAALIWNPELVDKLHKNGVKRAFFHQFCADTQYHFPQRQNLPEYDIAFIGNWDTSKKREKYLKTVADYNLGLWGSDYWNVRCREPSLRGISQGMCSYQDIPKFLGTAKMALNILRPQNEGGHNIRTYEIPATGTLMLSERSETLLNLFIEDREAVYFSSPEELREKVKYLMENQQLRESIAKAGYQKALKNTIAERVEEIKSLYQSLTFV